MTHPAQSLPDAPLQLMATSTLANIDRYLNAAGYEKNHPWRSEIGAALGGGVQASFGTDGILDGLDDIDCSVGILADLLAVALQKCVDAGTVGEAESVLRAARRYIDDIRSTTAQLSEGAK